MQKLINVLSVASFIVSAGVVAGGAYVYLNKDALIETAKEYAMDQVKDLLPEVPDFSEFGPDVPGSTDSLPVPLPF